MKLIDSSCWVHFSRQKGDPAADARVRQLLTTGHAAWCAPVRLELWNGVGNEHDRRLLRDLEQRIPELEITDDVWQSACDLANRCRKAGQTAPAVDVLIAACARHHGVDVEAVDAHFDFLMKL